MRCTVDTLLLPPAHQPYVVLSEDDAVANISILSGPRTLAVAVSVAYVMRCTVDILGGEPGTLPPPNHPSVLIPAAENLAVDILSGPRTLAVAVSVAKVIRSTVDPTVPGEGTPPPNQPSVVFPAAAK